MPYKIEKQHYIRDICIDYGITPGSSVCFFIKTGAGGSIYGYKDKYLQIAENINKKYGCTVICSSCPAELSVSNQELFMDLPMRYLF